MTDPLLAVDSLSVRIDTTDGAVQAVDGVAFEVHHGETVCLVGESGSGKTMTCDAITQLVDDSVTISGSIQFDDTELLELSGTKLRSIRGNRIAYVFQNAQSALDPVYTIGEQIHEALTFHDDVDETAARERATDLLGTVGLSRPADRVDQYPHELSDGMCQRAAIAVALAADPDLLIADEPTSALDAVVQARIVRLLDRLRQEQDLSLLLVTHDLRVVASLADRVVVLYGGTAVERGPVTDVFEHPGHPYTQALLDHFVSNDPDGDGTRAELPNTGCRFARECPHAIDDCRRERPSFEPVVPPRRATDGQSDDGATGDRSAHDAACIFHADGRHTSTVMGATGPTLDARSFDTGVADQPSPPEDPSSSTPGGDEDD